MGDTAIEWTNKTWNPVTGCSKVSEGCRNCYAERISLRFGRSKKPWTHPNAAENVVLHPDRLAAPLGWREPSMVFVNSMSDLFHEMVPFDFIDSVFEAMAAARQHTFQILTKRPERADEWRRTTTYLGGGDSLANVWIGVSIESQDHIGRAVELLGSDFDNFPVLFVSAEPLLGPVDLAGLLGDDLINWLIVGGESGPAARPMDPGWATALRDQAKGAGIPFFFKQWGGRAGKRGHGEAVIDGREWKEIPARAAVPA